MLDKTHYCNAAVRLVMAILLGIGASRAGELSLPKSFAGSWRVFGRVELVSTPDSVSIANGSVANLE
jgi:hypothetical protein